MDLSSTLPLATLRGALERRISSMVTAAPRATPTRQPITMPATAPCDSPELDEVDPPVTARALVTTLVLML